MNLLKPLFKPLFKPLLILAVALSTRPSRAGYVHDWTFSVLARSSDVLATAQVVSVETLGRDEGSGPQYPTLRRRALLRVLRAVAAAGQIAPAAGQMLPVEFHTFDYSHIDHSHIQVYVNTSPGVMPDVAAGQIFVFPLRHGLRHGAKRGAAGGAQHEEWRFIEGTGINMLTPALQEEPPRDVPALAAATGVDFLRSELAGVFVHGDEAQIMDATTRYHFAYWAGGSPLLNSFDLVEQNVHDEERWISIGAASLIVSSMTTPRVPLKLMLDKLGQPDAQKAWSEGERLQARVLAHLPREGLEERLLKAVLRQVKPGNSTSAEAILLVSDFADQPAARQAFEEGLQRESWGWIYAASWMSGEHHPLADVALAWARRHLAAGPEVKTPRQPWEFCWILRRWGTAEDVNALAARIEQARLAGDASYKVWLNACTSDDRTGRGQSEKALPPRVWSRVLDDNSLHQDGFPSWRWCDQAALEIGRAADLGFTIQSNSSLAARDQAVASARAWCLTHAPLP